MNHLRTIIAEFYLDLKAQKLRAFLTLFASFGNCRHRRAHRVRRRLQEADFGKHARDRREHRHRMARQNNEAVGRFGIGRGMSFVEEDAALIAPGPERQGDQP